MKRRVAVVSSSCPPRPGRPTTGGGLRTQQLVDTLRGAGHAVSVLVEDAALDEAVDGITAFAPAELEATLRRLRCSVVVLEQWGLAQHLGGLDKPLVIDLHGSLLLENVYRRGELDLVADAGTKLAALRRADLLLVPATAQLHHFGSWATLAGFDPRELPLALLPLAAEPIDGRTDASPALRLLYGGARWPWIDSLSALTTAADAVADGGSLDVCTYEPPRHGLAIAAELGTWPQVDERLADRANVTLRSGLGHAAWTERLAAATVALDLWAPNAERMLAATTRTVEFLQHGLPVITVEGSGWADALVQSGAGWTVPANDDDALATLLGELRDDPARIAAASAAATALIATRHALDANGAPLLAFVDRPHRPPRAEASLVDAWLAVKQRHLDDALASEQAAHAAEHERLVAAHRAEVQELRQAHAADLRQVVDDARAERDEAEAAHRAAVDELVDRHRQDAQAARRRAEDERNEQAERFRQERRAADAEHAQRLADHEARHRADAEERAVAHRAEADRLVAEWSERMAEATAGRRAETEAMEAAHRQAAEALATEWAERLRTAAAEHQEAQQRSADDHQRRSDALATEAAERLATETERLTAAWTERHQVATERHQAELRAVVEDWTGRLAAAVDQHQTELQAVVAEWTDKHGTIEERWRSDRHQAREARTRLEVELRATIAQLEERVASARAEAERHRSAAADAEQALEQATTLPGVSAALEALADRVKVPAGRGLPGRLGSAARLARLWVEHAVDRPRD